MPITQHTIAGFPPPPEGFAHVTSASGSRIVHISGQIGADETGAIVPGGLAAQTERALLNVALAVEAAGASVDDIARMTFYVVNWDPSMFEDLAKGGAAARAHRAFPEVAVTLLGVASLFTPDMLIEAEAVAVFDG
jgi:enamine deaminase RidA (YjgF/YER057c/UK114 family)